ncbi:MAG: rod shape-determining protein MreC [Gemmatimonadetes bacterium]|nr:rod shape-determining protein MreC [Gemmatimonadota bacterium]
MVSSRLTSRWDTLAFVACLLLSVAARAAPEAVQSWVASGVRSTLLAPLLAIQHQAELFSTSRTRLTTLVAERDAAVRAAMLVDALREENDRLRAVLELGPRISTTHVAAEVLHQASPVDGLTLILSAGSRRGVRSLAPVLAPGGLLGVVRSADRDRSVAVIWPHPDFRASAMTLDGSAFGIVAPRGAGGPNRMLLELSGVPYGVLIPPGTKLYTAGFGGVYPRGIPLGEVVAVATEVEGIERTYLVQPAVQPAAVSHVIILTGSAIDLSDAFVVPRP